MGGLGYAIEYFLDGFFLAGGTLMVWLTPLWVVLGTLWGAKTLRGDVEEPFLCEK